MLTLRDNDLDPVTDRLRQLAAKAAKEAQARHSELIQTLTEGPRFKLGDLPHIRKLMEEYRQAAQKEEADHGKLP